MPTPMPHTDSDIPAILYGLPPADLAEVPEGAAQVSPLIPGSARLEDVAEASLDAALLLAPPGTAERVDAYIATRSAAAA